MVLISLRWFYFDPKFDRSILDESETLCSIYNKFKRNFGTYCHILLSITLLSITLLSLALLSSHFNELIWRFQSRCSSKIMRMYLTLLQVLIFWPLILIFRCIGIYLDIYKNNNFSFTGIETDFICLKALTD